MNVNEIESFVQDMFIDAAWSEYPEKMTVEDAQINLNEWVNETDVPKGITATMIANEWNKLIDEGWFK